MDTVHSPEEIARRYQQRDDAKPLHPTHAPGTAPLWRNMGTEDAKMASTKAERVVECIRDSGADIIAMQETYGSGPRIAMHWLPPHLRSSNHRLSAAILR